MFNQVTDGGRALWSLWFEYCALETEFMGSNPDYGEVSFLLAFFFFFHLSFSHLCVHSLTHTMACWHMHLHSLRLVTGEAKREESCKFLVTPSVKQTQL